MRIVQRNLRKARRGLICAACLWALAAAFWLAPGREQPPEENGPEPPAIDTQSLYQAAEADFFSWQREDQVSISQRAVYQRPHTPEPEYVVEYTYRVGGGGAPRRYTYVLAPDQAGWRILSRAAG